MSGLYKMSKCFSFFSPGVVELFLLLMNLAVNLLSDLSKLKLSPQDLVLLLLKGSLSLLKSSLQLLLLLLKASALFVQVMDGTTSISKLIKQILDFISKVLVLPLHNIELFNSLIPSSLEAEEFAVEVSAFLLAGIN